MTETNGNGNGIIKNWHFILAMVVYTATLGIGWGTITAKQDEESRRTAAIEQELKSMVSHDDFEDFRNDIKGDIRDRLSRLEDRLLKDR